MEKIRNENNIRKPKTFAIGDIHGNYKALIQCIKKSKIDKSVDTLIVLGDVVDGWPDVIKSVEELLTFKNLIIIRGNHDQFFMDWMTTGYENMTWLQQGGYSTLYDYKDNPDVQDTHMKKYFNNSKMYHIDNDNRVFVHGGFNWHKPIEDNDSSTLMWDRHMFETAISWENFNAAHPDKPSNWFKDYKEVFIGHTSTEYQIVWNYVAGTKPVQIVNLINLDTGAGWGSGKLTIMDIDTKKYWQSDGADELYDLTERSR